MVLLTNLNNIKSILFFEELILIFKKKPRCEQCNSKMREVDSVLDKRTHLDSMLGVVRIFSNVYTRDIVKYRFFKCKKCNKIYRL